MTRWEPSVLRACAMAACAMTGAVPRSSHRRPAGARARRRPRSCSPIRSCMHSVGLPALVRREPRHRGARAPDHAPGSAGRGGSASRSASPLAAQIGVAPVLIPVFGSVPLARVSRPTWSPVPLAGPLTMLGARAGVVGGLVDRLVAPALAALLQVADRRLARPSHARGRRPRLAAARRRRRRAPRGRRRRPSALLGRGDSSGRGRRRNLPSRCAYRLGDARPRPHRPHAGDGHPQPHARLVLRPRRDFDARRVPPPGRGSWSPRAPTSSTSAG